MDGISTGQHQANLTAILNRQTEGSSGSVGKSAKTMVKLGVAGLLTGGYGLVAAVLGKTIIDSKAALTRHNSDRKVMQEASCAMQKKAISEMGDSRGLSNETTVEVREMLDTMNKIRENAHPTQKMLSKATAGTVGYNKNTPYTKPLSDILKSQMQSGAEAAAEVPSESKTGSVASALLQEARSVFRGAASTSIPNAFVDSLESADV